MFEFNKNEVILLDEERIITQMESIGFFEISYQGRINVVWHVYLR